MYELLQQVIKVDVSAIVAIIAGALTRWIEFKIRGLKATK
jgi:hypothetical protein